LRNLNKKRLLVFTSTFPRWKDDPKPSFVFELSKRLAKEFEVSVLAPHSPGARRKESLGGLSVYRFKYFKENCQKLNDFEGILSILSHRKLLYLLVPFFIVVELIALLKYVVRNEPDLIHAHWIIPQGFIAYLNHKILKTPYVITSHGSDVMGLKGFNFVKRLTLKSAKKITVVSNEIKRKILHEIDSGLRIETIPMGVDTNIFSPQMKDESLLREHNIKGPFLLFVGRISAEKGIKYLIHAMPAVIAEYPNVKLLIIGDSDQKNELMELVKHQNLQQHVVFIGKLLNEKLPRYYATADAFICPSFREGSPVTYIESLACGTPIVVGDLPMSREIVLENRGLLVKQNDSRDISRKIIGLLKTKKCLEKDLHNFVKSHYDWTVITKKIQKILAC